MSDRRPEPKLLMLIEEPCEHGPLVDWLDDHNMAPHGCGCSHWMGEPHPPGCIGDCDGGTRTEGSPADLLAVVRRGLESGTIKGKVQMWCPAHESPWYGDEGLCQRAAAAEAWKENDRMWMECEFVERRLVIPISDGGSET